MASDATPLVPMGDAPPDGAALQHKHWRKLPDLSSGLARCEQFLAESRFELANWVVVAFAAGIAAWFASANAWQWRGIIAAALALSVGVSALLRAEGPFPYVRRSLVVGGMAVALGCGFVWAKSALVGTAPIARPSVVSIVGRILAREEQPAQDRVRLRLATREPGSGRAMLVRVNLDRSGDQPGLAEGAVVQLRARLVPPAPPMLPGGYDFARAAWFSGIAATGSVLGPIKVLEPGASGGLLRETQRRLSQHVRENLDGSPGALAAAFASGDRGAIAPEDEDAMRDAGLTHLLSISGLHVSAVIAAAYFIALRLFAAIPWLARGCGCRYWRPGRARRRGSAIPC